MSWVGQGRQLGYRLVLSIFSHPQRLDAHRCAWGSRANTLMIKSTALVPSLGRTTWHRLCFRERVGVDRFSQWFPCVSMANWLFWPFWLSIRWLDHPCCAILRLQFMISILSMFSNIFMFGCCSYFTAAALIGVIIIAGPVGVIVVRVPVVTSMLVVIAYQDVELVAWFSSLLCVLLPRWYRCLVHCLLI